MTAVAAPLDVELAELTVVRRRHPWRWLSAGLMAVRRSAARRRLPEQALRLGRRLALPA
ncbi:hypothetical protein [Nocardioides maradonensis]